MTRLQQLRRTARFRCLGADVQLVASDDLGDAPPEPQSRPDVNSDTSTDAWRRGEGALAFSFGEGGHIRFVVSSVGRSISVSSNLQPTCGVPAPAHCLTWRCEVDFRGDVVTSIALAGPSDEFILCGFRSGRIIVYTAQSQHHRNRQQDTHAPAEPNHWCSRSWVSALRQNASFPSTEHFNPHVVFDFYFRDEIDPIVEFTNVNIVPTCGGIGVKPPASLFPCPLDAARDQPLLDVAVLFEDGTILTFPQWILLEAAEFGSAWWSAFRYAQSASSKASVVRDNDGSIPPLIQTFHHTWRASQRRGHEHYDPREAAIGVHIVASLVCMEGNAINCDTQLQKCTLESNSNAEATRQQHCKFQIRSYVTTRGALFACFQSAVTTTNPFVTVVIADVLHDISVGKIVLSVSRTHKESEHRGELLFVDVANANAEVTGAAWAMPTIANDHTHRAQVAMCAITDTSGRVRVYRAPENQVIKVFKGYRDASCQWTHHIGFDARNTVAAKHDAGSFFLVIHAPQRSKIQIWNMCSGCQVCSIDMGASNGYLRAVYVSTVGDFDDSSRCRCFVLSKQGSDNALLDIFDVFECSLLWSCWNQSQRRRAKAIHDSASKLRTSVSLEESTDSMCVAIEDKVWTSCILFIALQFTLTHCLP